MIQQYNRHSSKFKFKKFFIGAVLLTLQSVSSAAVVSIENSPLIFDQSSPLTIKIIATGFTAGSAGGGLSLHWDPAVLSLNPGNISILFPSDSGLGINTTVGSVDNTTGFLTGMMIEPQFAFPPDPYGTSKSNFDIASITFDLVNAGNSVLDLAFYQDFATTLGQWFDLNATDTNPIFIDGTIQVAAVPLPSAIFMMVPALLGFGWFRRKSTA